MKISIIQFMFWMWMSLWTCCKVL